MMRAKKILCLLLAVITLCACFAGCNGQTNDEKKELPHSGANVIMLSLHELSFS